MKRILRGPSNVIEKMRNTSSDQDPDLLAYLDLIGSAMMSMKGDSSHLKIERADEESVMTMVTDLLHSYSVDLATYLAVSRRKEQDEAICTGAKMLLMDQPTILPKLEESLELQRSILVPQHERCTEAEIDYIIQQQLYLFTNPAELLCMSPERMTTLRVLSLYEKGMLPQSVGSSCRFCGNWETMGKEFPECAACGLVTYCSKECQKADWKRHKQQDCKQVNDSEKRKERRLDKRLDRFMRLYGPLLLSALVDKYAILAKEKNVDAETICNTHIISILLTDLPTGIATRPYLQLSRITIHNEADVWRDVNGMISHANKLKENNLVIHYRIEHEGYGGRSVCYGSSLGREFKYLVQHCSREELSASKDCKTYTINSIAVGNNPVLHKAIKKVIESKEEKTATKGNGPEK